MLKVTNKFQLKNEEVKKRITFEIPEAINGLPKLHWVEMIIAPTGIGKSNMAVNQVNEAVKQELYDWIILVSTTGVLKPGACVLQDTIWEEVKIDRREPAYSRDLFDSIRDDQDKRIEKYKEYEDYNKVYQKYAKMKYEMTTEEVEALVANDFMEPENPNPKNKERMPTQLLIFDDLGIISEDKDLKNFITQTRHSNTSWMCLIQSYTMIPKMMREQVNALVFFELPEDRLKSIYETYVSASDMSFKEFETLPDLLINSWDFIMILKKSAMTEKYRLGFSDCITTITMEEKIKKRLLSKPNV